MEDVYINIDEYNPNRKCNGFMPFEYIIGDMITKKKLRPIVVELFITGQKLNIYTGFITQFYFQAPKDIRINSLHCFVVEIPNKR